VAWYPLKLTNDAMTTAAGAEGEGSGWMDGWKEGWKEGQKKLVGCTEVERERERERET
jgi:hypothetical protein